MPRVSRHRVVGAPNQSLMPQLGRWLHYTFPMTIALPQVEDHCSGWSGLMNELSDIREDLFSSLAGSVVSGAKAVMPGQSGSVNLPSNGVCGCHDMTKTIAMSCGRIS